MVKAPRWMICILAAARSLAGAPHGAAEQLLTSASAGGAHLAISIGAMLSVLRQNDAGLVLARCGKPPRRSRMHLSVLRLALILQVSLTALPSKRLGLFAADGTLIVRSDSNGEDLEAFAGAGAT